MLTIDGRHRRKKKPSPLRVFLAKRWEQLSATWWREQSVAPAEGARYFHKLVKLVDIETRIRHLLTWAAFDLGHSGEGDYIALCGVVVIPASMVEPGCRDCGDCFDFIPGQRRPE